MKYLFLYTLVLTASLYHEKAHCQSSKDTLWAQSVRAMQKDLALSDSISTLLLHTGEEQLREAALLNTRKTAGVEDRQQALKEIQHKFHQRVQNILTPQQWKQYQELEEAMRSRFINNAKNKNIPYKELGS